MIFLMQWCIRSSCTACHAIPVTHVPPHSVTDNSNHQWAINPSHNISLSAYNPVHWTSSISLTSHPTSPSLLCPDHLSIHERHLTLWQVSGNSSMVSLNIEIISVILNIHIIGTSFFPWLHIWSQSWDWVILNLVKPWSSWIWGTCFPHHWNFNNQ